MEVSSSSASKREVSANGSTSTILKDEINTSSNKNKGIVLDDQNYSFNEEYDYGSDQYDNYYYDDGDDQFDEHCFHDEFDCYMNASKTDSKLNMASMFEDIDLPPGVEVTFNDLDSVDQNDEVAVKFKSFKQFDSVNDPSDHHFSTPKLLKIIDAGLEPGKNWIKRIQHEWKLLEKHLPETIYVRIYEGRMDLLRAVIVGPAGTPYHDGLFFFDIYFPASYPLVPPMVHYHSRGLRLNPNLYACGKVCLSLLNTWPGSDCEKWRPSESTMLQVLVSIQALILNAKPYFNEPGYETIANTVKGENASLAYSDTAFILSCKTMLYSLQNPPKHFESFVVGHFRYRGRTILMACKSYLEGAQVGSLACAKVQNVAEPDGSSSSTSKAKLGTDLVVKEEHRRYSTFIKDLSSHFEQLLMEFTVCGADCRLFLSEKVKEGAAKSASSNQDNN